MAMRLVVRKKGPGFVGSVVCVLRGRRLWSESSGIVRVNKDDAKSDAKWLRDQHEIAGRNSL